MSFYDTILARAKSVSPNLITNDTLFQTLLLALISDEKHVIIRTHEDSIARISGQVVNVSSNLSKTSRTNQIPLCTVCCLPKVSVAGSGAA